MSDLNKLALRVYERELLKQLNAIPQVALDEAVERARTALDNAGFSDEALDVAPAAFQLLRSSSVISHGVLNPKVLWRDFQRRLWFFFVKAQADRFRSLIEHLDKALPSISRYVLFGGEDILLAAYTTEQGANQLHKYFARRPYIYDSIEIENSLIFAGFHAENVSLQTSAIDRAAVNKLVEDFNNPIDDTVKEKLLRGKIVLGGSYQEDLGATGRLRAFIVVTPIRYSNEAREEFVSNVKQLKNEEVYLRSLHLVHQSNKFILDVVCENIQSLWLLTKRLRAGMLSSQRDAVVETLTHVVADAKEILPRYAPARGTDPPLLLGLEYISSLTSVKEEYIRSMSEEDRTMFGDLDPDTRFHLISLMTAVETAATQWIPDECAKAVRQSVRNIAQGILKQQPSYVIDGVAALGSVVEEYMQGVLRMTLKSMHGTIKEGIKQLHLNKSRGLTRYSLKDSLLALKGMRRNKEYMQMFLVSRESTLFHVEQVRIQRNWTTHRGMATIEWKNDSRRMMEDSHDAVCAAMRVLVDVQKDIIHCSPLDALNDPPSLTKDYIALIQTRKCRKHLFASTVGSRVGEGGVVFWTLIRCLNALARAGDRKGFEEILKILKVKSSRLLGTVKSEEEKRELEAISVYVEENLRDLPLQLLADRIAMPLIYAEWETAQATVDALLKALPDYSSCKWN